MNCFSALHTEEALTADGGTRKSALETAAGPIPFTYADHFYIDPSWNPQSGRPPSTLWIIVGSSETLTSDDAESVDMTMTERIVRESVLISIV